QHPGGEAADGRRPGGDEARRQGERRVARVRAHRRSEHAEAAEVDQIQQYRSTHDGVQYGERGRERSHPGSAARHLQGDVMKLSVHLLTFALALVVATALVLAAESFYDLKTKTLLGKDGNLAQYKGKVSLVVNVASKCGFTPQYEGLEKLQREMKGKPFNVLGFPSNDFGQQEPGSAEEIAQFCK